MAMGTHWEESALQNRVWALRAELDEAVRASDQDVEALHMAPKSFQETQNWGRAASRLQQSLQSDARFDMFTMRARAATAHRVVAAAETVTEYSAEKEYAVVQESKQRLLRASARRSAQGLSGLARATAALAEASERHARTVGSRALETARRAEMTGCRTVLWTAETALREHGEAARAAQASDKQAYEDAWQHEIQRREQRAQGKVLRDKRTAAAQQAAAAAAAERHVRAVSSKLVARFDADGDGTLDAAEFRRLLRFDTNRNGQLDRVERRKLLAELSRARSA